MEADEVTVFSWSVVGAEDLDNLETAVELTGAMDAASTLGLAFASTLIAANMF
jgi:hypothetical protein